MHQFIFLPILHKGSLFLKPLPTLVIYWLFDNSHFNRCDTEEAEWFYEDLRDLLELTPKRDVLFIIRDWNAKVGSKETPGVTGKFGLGIRNEASKG